MKIETNGRIAFGKIKQGEVFTTQGFYYLKIESYTDSINVVHLKQET